MDDLVARSIILTVAYSAQFGFPLTKDEVWQRLICKKNVTIKDKASVDKAIDDLIFQKMLFFDRNMISTRNKNELVDRAKRRRYTLQKLEEARNISNTLLKIPWILAVGVTGSVAAENATENDDIDFIIITKDHRLWLTRLWVTALAFFSGKRRSWNHEEENSWCFNLWLEKNALQFSPKEGVLYVAFELCQVQWLFQREDILYELLQKNNWVAKILPNYFAKQLSVIERVKSAKSNTNDAALTGILNELAYKAQRLYMRQHITRERVSRLYAFFHPRDTAGDVGKNWKAEIEQWSKYAHR